MGVGVEVGSSDRVSSSQGAFTSLASKHPLLSKLKINQGAGDGITEFTGIKDLCRASLSVSIRCVSVGKEGSSEGIGVEST